MSVGSSNGTLAGIVADLQANLDWLLSNATLGGTAGGVTASDMGERRQKWWQTMANVRAGLVKLGAVVGLGQDSRR